MEDTQTGQVNAESLDFSSVLTQQGSKSEAVNVPETVPQDVVQPAVQEVQNEFIIVDGERVELNLDEVIGSHPDGTPIKLRDTDNPKSYKFFQARDSKKERELKELRELVKGVQKPQEVKPEPKPIPTRPVFPTRPKDYDPTEAVTNPDSVSYKFEREKEDYYAQKDAYDLYRENELMTFKGQIESEKEVQLKSQAELEYQAKMLGEIQRVGGVDVSEAKEIWTEFTTPKNDQEFLKDVVDFHHFKKGKLNPQAQAKVDQFNRNGQRQAQYVAPPGVIGSQAPPDDFDFGKEVLKTAQKFRL